MYSFQSSEEANTRFNEYLAIYQEQLRTELSKVTTNLEAIKIVQTLKMNPNAQLLLEKKKLILSLNPKLEEQYKILDFFARNNALSIEQVDIVTKQILQDEVIEKQIDNNSKFSITKRQLEEHLYAFENRDILTTATLVGESTLSEQDKLAVLAQLAMKSCAQTKKQETEVLEQEQPEIVQETSINSDEADEIQEMGDISALKERYYSVYKSKVEQFIKKYYHLIDNKTDQEIAYAKNLYDAICDSKEDIGLDDLQYFDVNMTVHLLSLIDTKKEMEKILNTDSPVDKADEEVATLFLEDLESSYTEACKLVEKQVEEEQAEDDMVPSKLYFLLDEAGNPPYKVSNFNADEKKKFLTLIDKLNRNIYDYEKGIKHTKVQSKKKMDYDIYVNKISNMSVSYLRLPEHQVLVLTFGTAEDIFDESLSIASRRSADIARAQDAIGKQDTQFLAQQQEFSARFHEQLVASKGDGQK